MSAPRWMVLLLVFAAWPAAALPPPDFLQRQQADYHAARRQWDTVKLPPGVAPADGPVDAYDSGIEGVWVRIHNVDLYFQADIGFHAIDVNAKLVPDAPGTPVNLNRPDRFSIEVYNGCARLTPAQLTALFNEHILDYRPRPLNDLTLTTRDDVLAIDGQIKLWSWFPGFWMPLFLRGPLTLGDDGALVYTPQRIDAMYLRAKTLLHLTHIALDDLLAIDRPGVSVGEDAIRLDVTRVFPPPPITTAPDRVSVADAGVTICFDARADIELTPPDDAGDSYIWVQAGDLAALDKLIVNAHVLVQPVNGATMRFSIPNYKAQIARGALGMRSDGTLLVRVPPSRPDTRATRGD